MLNSRKLSNILLVKYPLITDKSMRLSPKGQYTVIVDPRASKDEIKTIFELLFEVKVIKVNTCNLPKKTRRVGKYLGTKSKYKKAILTIKRENNESINFFSTN